MRRLDGGPTTTAAAAVSTTAVAVQSHERTRRVIQCIIFHDRSPPRYLCRRKSWGNWVLEKESTPSRSSSSASPPPSSEFSLACTSARIFNFPLAGRRERRKEHCKRVLACSNVFTWNRCILFSLQEAAAASAQSTVGGGA